MTLEKLLGKLRGDYERVGNLIKQLSPYVETPATARKVLKATAALRDGKAKPKRKVWAHTPAGKKHMRKMQRIRLANRRHNGAKETSSTKS